MNRILRLTLAATIALSLLGLAVEIAGAEGLAWLGVGLVLGLVAPWIADQVIAWYHRAELRREVERSWRRPV